jgi:hypothetical protein
MPRKSSPEAAVQQYFETASLAKAEVMLELAKATLRRRQKAEKHEVAPVASSGISLHTT